MLPAKASQYARLISFVCKLIKAQTKAQEEIPTMARTIRIINHNMVPGFAKNKLVSGIQKEEAPNIPKNMM